MLLAAHAPMGRPATRGKDEENICLYYPSGNPARYQEAAQGSNAFIHIIQDKLSNSTAIELIAAVAPEVFLMALRWV